MNGRDFNPHVTVATLVREGERFLMVEEWSNGCAVFNQPAGHLDANESLIQAALRETLEETAWEVELTGVLGIYLYTAPNGITYQRVAFTANPVRQTTRTLDTGIIRACWMTTDELRAHQADLRSPLVLRCVEDALAGQSFPLELIR